MARKKDENIVVEENVIESADVDNNITEFKDTTNKYKTELCRILAYNSITKELDVDFKNYGVRIQNVSNVKDDYVTVKYKGDIGKPNFICKL